MPFPWQGEQWQQVQRAMEAGRMPHAWLLAGSAGSGKRDFARALAARLLCQSPVAQAACGNCESCKLWAAGNHPDFQVLEPEEGKRQIKVDSVRAVQDFVGQTAFLGGYKVVLMHPAEAMNQSTANAFLKTLEEPAGNTVLLLCSNAPGQLLATIRSRCRVLDFPLPAQAESLAWLEQRVGDRAGLLLAESAGQPLSALQLFESDGLALRQQLDATAEKLLNNDCSAVQAAEAFAEADLDTVLDWLAQRLHALSKQDLAAQPMTEFAGQCWQAARAAPARLVVQFLIEVLELTRLLHRGANPAVKSSFERLALGITRLGKSE